MKENNPEYRPRAEIFGAEVPAHPQPREGGWRIVYQEIGRRGPGTVYRGSNLSEIQCARVWLVALQEGGRILVKPEREGEGEECWGPSPHLWCLESCARCAHRRRGSRLIHPLERQQRQAVRAVVSISPGPLGCGDPQGTL